VISPKPVSRSQKQIEFGRLRIPSPSLKDFPISTHLLRDSQRKPSPPPTLGIFLRPPDLNPKPYGNPKLNQG